MWWKFLLTINYLGDLVEETGMLPDELLFRLRTMVLLLVSQSLQRQRVLNRAQARTMHTMSWIQLRHLLLLLLLQPLFTKTRYWFSYKILQALKTTKTSFAHPTLVFQICPICLTNPKDMAFGCGHQVNPSLSIHVLLSIARSINIIVTSRIRRHAVIVAKPFNYAQSAAVQSRPESSSTEVSTSTLQTLRFSMHSWCTDYPVAVFFVLFPVHRHWWDLAEHSLD